MEEAGTAVRMAGYLEKRGKLKLMSNWKKYWFVLEGQLLLYYKSQLEYINLSACRGSLNIGIASCVRPGHGLTIQVVTRTQCVTLKTKERALQEQWLQALLDSMALPNTSSLKRQSTGTQHFRYSLDNLPAIHEDGEPPSKVHEKKFTLPRRVTRRDSIVHRLRKMGGVSYGDRSDSTQLKTHQLELAHKLLSKSSSTSMIETEKANLGSLQDVNNVDESRQSKKTSDTFQKNLNAVHNCLKETSMDRQLSNNPGDIANNADLSSEHTIPDIQGTMSTTIIEVNADYMTHSHQQDENQNSCILPGNILYEETINESNYCYDSLKTVQQRSEDDDEKVEYCGYDTVALVPGAPQDDEEPDLPPRPVHEATNIDGDQDSEYEEVNLVECGLAKRASTEKKHSNFRDMILLKDFRHQKLFKKTSKDKTVQQPDMPVTERKKKRKPSFLQKFVLKHKKEASQVETEKKVPSESEEEPEYESVCFQQKEPMLTDESFQMQLLMPADTMNELKNRLRNEHNSDEDYETIGSATTEDRAPSLGEKTPEPGAENTMPSYTTTSTEHLYATSHKPRTRKNSLTIDIPSLPLRRTNRPPSPWHDVPTNNSPAYDALLGNPLDCSINCENSLSTHKQSVSFQIVPDEILNTPQGFLAITNQWRKVEKSGDWNREHQQVAFPNKGKASCEPLVNEVVEDQNGNGLKNITIIQCTENDDNEPDSLEKNILEYEDCDRNEEKDCCEDMIRINIDTSLEVVNNNNHTIVEPSDVKTGNLVDLSTNNSQDVKRDGMERYSDELHLLLAQLAEITSAPLFHIGATKSLLMPTTTTYTTLDTELGPIRRRRHSEPDYDVPRPHGPSRVDAVDSSMSPDSLELQPSVTDGY